MANVLQWMHVPWDDYDVLGCEDYDSEIAAWSTGCIRTCLILAAC